MYLLDPGTTGSLIMVLDGRLEPDEISKPVATVVQEELSQIDALLVPQFKIHADSQGERATPAPRGRARSRSALTFCARALV